MIEINVWVVLAVLVIAVLLVVLGFVIGVTNFEKYIFYRVRNMPGIDPSNMDQVRAPLVQMTTRFTDYKKMYFLTEEMHRVLAEAGLAAIKCFPSIGLDYSWYGMVRPVE